MLSILIYYTKIVYIVPHPRDHVPDSKHEQLDKLRPAQSQAHMSLEFVTLTLINIHHQG